MILIILAVAAVLRLIGLGQSLWLDEAINVNNAAGLSLNDLIFNYSLGDFHPPLYHILLSTWIGFFGSLEISVRVPSVIFGVATVYFTYLLAQKLFETKTALVAATLMATAPLHIYYSGEARMYALAAFFASVSVYFFLSLLKKDTWVLWLGFISSTVLMLYTDYLPYTLMPIYIVFLTVLRRKIAKHTLAAFIPAFIIILTFIVPWLTILPTQLATGLSAAAASPAWAHVVGSPSLQSLAITFVKFTIGRISHDNNLIYALIMTPIALYLAFLFFLSFFRLSPVRSFLHYFLFGPIVLALAISAFIPVFAYFRFLFVLPAFYTILASATTIVNWPPLTRMMLALLLIINLTSTSIYLTNPKFQRENWRQATDYIYQNSTPTTLVLFESTFPAAPFDYYSQKSSAYSKKSSAYSQKSSAYSDVRSSKLSFNLGQGKAAGALDSFTADAEKIKEKLELFSAYDKIYLFQYLSQITDPDGLVYEILTQKGYVNTSTRDFTGVGFVYEFQHF